METIYIYLDRASIGKETNYLLLKDEGYLIIERIQDGSGNTRRQLPGRSASRRFELCARGLMKGVKVIKQILFRIAVTTGIKIGLL